MANNQDLKLVLSAVDELSPTLKKSLDVLEQVNQGVKDIADTSKKTSDDTDHLRNSHLELAAGLEIVVTAVEVVEKAFEGLERTLEKAVEEALSMEKANNLLVGSLVSTGQYTSEVTETLKAYSEQVEETTGVDAELVKSHIAIGVQMGLTVDKAKEMEEASRRLAVLTGGDVNQAFSMLQGTLSGQGRSLGRLLPQVKELTTGQLQSGQAIQIVNQALQAQYQIYQTSFSTSLAKAQAGIANVYKAFGNIIVQSPAVKESLNAFIEGTVKLTNTIQIAGNWITKHQEQIISVGKAFGQAVLLVGGFSLALGAAASATTALGAAFAFLTGPFGIALTTVAALTAAFQKWPGLFDIIVGGLKTLSATFITGLSIMTEGAGKLAGIFNKDLANSLNSIKDRLSQVSDELGIAGAKQIDLGLASNKAAEATKSLGDAASESSKKQVAATEAALQKQNELAKSRLALIQTYGEYEVGTDAQRKQLEIQKGDLDKAYKDFEQYYNNKISLAISKEAEQAERIASFKAKTVLGGPEQSGAAGNDAAAQAEIVAQQNRQVRLKQALDEELITRQQYQQAVLQSELAYQTASYNQQVAYDQVIATALGQSEQGYLQRKQILIGQLQIMDQNALAQAEAAGATQQQLEQIKIEQAQAAQQKMAEMDQQYLQQKIARDEALGDSWQATLDRIELAQKKHGVVMGTLQAVQSSSEFQTVNKGLSNLASLRNSKSKDAFEIGKKAAIAQATVQTALAATEAFASLASIPFVGPVLGAAAAAAAIAAGVVQIQNISSQQFNAQAHGGMDEVPADLNNKTFILKAGERVVQPEANKDLTAFLASQKQGNEGGAQQGASGGGTPTIVQLTVNGTATQQDMRNTTDMLIQELRRASERGQLVISAKGVY